MKTLALLIVVGTIFASVQLHSQEKKQYRIHTVAFYNVENLFDTEDDPLTFDNDRTPKGKDRWTEEIYQKKLSNTATVIGKIGLELSQNTPALIGLCEIENFRVLEDLVSQPALVDKQYGIIHFDSPDRRGIDVALLYRTDVFIPKKAVVHPLLLFDEKEPQKRIYTRDQLVVSGYLEGEEIHLLINHWPSRSGGVTASSPKREKAALLSRSIIDSIYGTSPYAKIITMGDFNDDPANRSVREILQASPTRDSLSPRGLFNPMAALHENGIGSLAYRDSWNLFDQIIISEALLRREYTGFQFFRAHIFNEKFLETPTGQYKGYPFRSFGSSGYTGGYSDHFPVYIYLIKENF